MLDRRIRPCGLFRQCRVTPAPLFLRSASRRGPRHASRPFPFLPLSSPAPPPGKVSYGKLREPAARFSACHGCHGKSVSWKTASPGLAAVVVTRAAVAFRASPLAGCELILANSTSKVKPIFEKSCIFFAKSSQTRVVAGVSGVRFLASEAPYREETGAFEGILERKTHRKRAKAPLPCPTSTTQEAID